MKKLRETLLALLHLSQEWKTTSRLSSELKAGISNVHSNLKRLEREGLADKKKEGNAGFWKLTKQGAWLKAYASSNPKVLDLTGWSEVGALLKIRKDNAAKLDTLSKRSLRKLLFEGIVERSASDLYSLPKAYSELEFERAAPVKEEVRFSKVVDLSHKLSGDMMRFWLEEEPFRVQTISYKATEKKFMTVSVVNNLRSQIGTSVDLRGHITSDPSKEKGVSDYAPDTFVRPAVVADLHYKAELFTPYLENSYFLNLKSMEEENQKKLLAMLEIGQQELKAACEKANAKEGDILLLRTGFDKYWIDAPVRTSMSQPPAYRMNPYLSYEAISWIEKLGFRGVGIDAYSIEKPALPLSTPKGKIRYEVEEDPMRHDLLLDHGIIIENLTNLERIQGRRVVFAAIPAKIDGCVDGFPVWAVALV